MLVGRHDEQTALSDLLGRLRAGSGRLLTLVGDAGFGKTTLLDWTESQADGITVLRARGRPSEADLPFVALADLLRPLTDGIGDLPGPQHQALGAALALIEGSAVDRGAVNAAALTLLTNQHRPLLLLVDDYHWLDTASREVIDFIARRVETEGLSLVAATRDSLIDDRAPAIRLEPISTEAASELLRNRDHMSPEAEKRILRLAAGNPLALLELPLDPSPLESEPFAGRQVSLSAALDEAYRYRLDQLPDRTRKALLCAALEGSETTSVLWRALDVMGIERSATEAAESADLIAVDAHHFRFRHPLLRSVLIQGAAAEDIADAHRALAKAADDEDQRAWYLAAASSAPDAQIATALEETARRALDRGAAGTAAAAFERAAELTESPEAKSARLVAAARAAHKAGLMTLTARLIDLARSTGSADVPGLHLLDADIRMRRGDVAGAYGTLRLQAARIAGEDPYRAATMLLVAAKLRVYRFEAAAALEEVEEALALISVDEHNLLHLGALSMARVMAGDPNAKEAVLQAMEAALSSPHGHTHTLGIGWPLVWLEEYERARAFISRSISIQREGGHLAYLPQALLPMAELDFRTGRWDKAREAAAEAFVLFDEGQQPTEAAFAAGLLARIEACSGDEDSTSRHAGLAAAGDVGTGMRGATAYAEAALGMLELGLGRPAKATVYLGRALTILREGAIGQPWLLPIEADLAEAHARNGNPTEARLLAEDIIDRGKGAGSRSAVAAGLRSLGLVADDDSFSRIFEEALLIHGSMPVPFETARTELCFGERLRRSRQRADSRVRLRRALDIFESLGAAPWASRARTELLATGETLQRNATPVRLTPQERQVACVVASGATNREAAAELFVSSKTIEFHLGNVYRKLGVRSRTELANALAGERLTPGEPRPAAT